MKPLVVVAGSLVGVGLLLWAGLRVPARPYPAVESAEVETPPTVTVPGDLPEPVDRFYREVYGDEVPVIDTVVVTGRGTMRISGVTLPVRFRFTHQTGRAYRHEIQTTLYGAGIMDVDEVMRDGRARLELPFGVSEGPNVDQGANLALWAEAVWMPSVWITDPRTRWEPVDEHTAVLVVPFGDDEESFVARFDPDSGMLRMLESMRFKAEDDTTKTLWLNEVAAWGDLDGRRLPIRTALTWLDDGTPWAELTTEEVRYQVALGDDLRASSAGK